MLRIFNKNTFHVVYLLLFSSFHASPRSFSLLTVALASLFFLSCWISRILSALPLRAISATHICVNVEMKKTFRKRRKRKKSFKKKPPTWICLLLELYKIVLFLEGFFCGRLREWEKKKERRKEKIRKSSKNITHIRSRRCSLSPTSRHIITRSILHTLFCHRARGLLKRCGFFSGRQNTFCFFFVVFDVLTLCFER